MNADRHVWGIWVKALQRWGMHDLVATLLEAVGPLTMLGAQAVYLSQPLLNSIAPRDHWEALAKMLENPAEAQQFANFLREGISL